MNDSKLEAALGPNYSLASVGYDHEPERYHKVMETALPLTVDDLYVMKKGAHIFVWNNDNEVVSREGTFLGVEEVLHDGLGETYVVKMMTEYGEQEVFACFMGITYLWTTKLQAYRTYVMPPR